MTATDPIINAVALTRVALYAALAPLTPTFAGRPACYWERADAQGIAGALTSVPATLTAAIISQIQAPFQDDPQIGTAGTSGLITVKAISGVLSDAEALLAAVAPALAGLSAPAGYSISARWVSAPPIPTKDGIATAAAIYRISLYRN